MAKTKNAFALRDFDETRILQRKFFSGLRLPPNMTDAEILKSFDFSTAETAEKSGEKLALIQYNLNCYHMRIKKHLDKLSTLEYDCSIKFTEGWGEKFKTMYHEAFSLMMFYQEYMLRGIYALIIESSNILDKCKNFIQQHYKKTFADRLKQARKEKSYTQEQLAEKLGVARITLTQYERAVNEPNFSMLVKIAKILDVSLDWLAGLSDNKKD